MARKRTRTKDFGVSTRESHDSSSFYASRLYENIDLTSKKEIVDNSIEFLKMDFNQFQKHPYTMLKNKIPLSSVHLIIYEVILSNIESNEALNLELIKYSSQIENLYKKLITGGRIIVIVSNIMKKGNSQPSFYPLHSTITKLLINQQFFLRGNIILIQEQENLEQFNHSLSNHYKLAIIASKETMKREKKNKKLNFEKTNTISRDDFLSATKSIWSPIHSDEKENFENYSWELEYYFRIIQLYSFHEDIILIMRNDSSNDFSKKCQEIRNNCFFFDQC